MCRAAWWLGRGSVGLAALVMAACSVGNPTDELTGAAVAPSDSEAPADDVTGSSSAASTDSPASEPALQPLDLETVTAGAYDWRRMPLGAGGFVTGLAATAVDGESTLYARTDVGGAYRWEPSTRTWEQLVRASRLEGASLGPADYYVLSIAVAPNDPQRVYMAVGNDFNPSPGDESAEGAGRILRSDDGGRTWDASSQRWFVGGNQRFRTTGERLSVHPDDPDLVVFGSQRDGLWISRDAGRTWERVPFSDVGTGLGDELSNDQAGISFTTFFRSSPDEVDLFVGVANEAILRSPDGGATWDEVLALAPGDVPASASSSAAGTAFVVGNTAGAVGRLFRWSPGVGLEELDPPTGASVWHVAVDPADPATMVVAGEAIRSGAVWSSTDGGRTWSSHDVAIESDEIPWLEQTDLTEYMSVGRLLFDPAGSGDLWFGEGMGVWTTDDLSATTIVWRSSALGIEELVVADLVSPPGGTPIVAVADRQGFVLVPDRMPSATLIDERFASGASVDFSGAAPEHLAWVGAESHLAWSPDRNARGAVSDDGGATWVEMGGLEYEMFGGEVALSATEPDTIVWLPTRYADANPDPVDPLGIYASHDGGRSWSWAAIDGGADNFHRLFWWLGRRALAADRVDGSFYLVSDDARMYVSRDGARTWMRSAHAPPCTTVDACHVFGQIAADPGRASVLWASTGTAGLHVTEDAGATPWRAIDVVAEASAIALGPPMEGSDVSTVFIVGTLVDGRSGVLRSTDGGTSWLLVAADPADLAAQITVIEADADVPGRVYVGFAGLGVVVGDPTGTDR